MLVAAMQRAREMLAGARKHQPWSDDALCRSDQPAMLARPATLRPSSHVRRIVP
jgi:hypothetical protein